LRAFVKLMDLFISVDPADLQRFRASAILKSCRLGKSRTSAHVTRTPIGGAKWRAEMSVDTTGPACRIGFTLLEGSAAPLSMLLQALAERVPLRLANGAEPPDQPFVKAKLPALPAGASNGEALRLIAAACLAHLTSNHHCLLASGAPESIHQMRVALRRLRSALSLFKAMLHDPHSQALRAELRWMQQCLGAARDADVLIAEILAPVEREFGSARGLHELVKLVEQRRKSDRAAMLAEVKSPRFTKGLLRLACWLEDMPPADGPVRELALDTLNRRYRRVRKQMSRFHKLDEAGRHDVRIQIKKLRYSIDFFGGLISDRRAAKMTGQLAALQEVFGHLNDIASGNRLLHQIASQSAAPNISWAAGLVTGWHQNRVDDLLRQAWNLWHELEKTPAFWKVNEN
jgi:triphosphatase